MTEARVRIVLLTDWDVSNPPSVFQTREYLDAWWRAFGRGDRLILRATDGDRHITAPLFAEAGMVYFVGSGGSDYLDFAGGPVTEDLLVDILAEARERTAGFQGFCFYHVPERSRTTEALARVATRMNLTLQEEYSMAAARMAFAALSGASHPAHKKSLRRHENTLARLGHLRVHRAESPAEMLSWLPQFFDQHIDRWRDTSSPSLFLDPKQRTFYETLVSTGADFLRMTRVDCDGRPVAFHFGFSYQGEYLWYKPSYDRGMARYSPGEVLLRHLILAAEEEGCHTFDFGLGDEAFKRRFATSVETVRSWGLYPR